MVGSSASQEHSARQEGSPSSEVYLNGAFLPRGKAKIDIEDRGFIFADGVYEVIRYYDGVAFAMDMHIQRLERSLAAIRIEAPGLLQEMHAISDELVRRNHLPQASLYWQVTRGSAPRNHAIPPDIKPTVMAIAYPGQDLHTQTTPRSLHATLEPDQRWARCDIKSLMLLASVLAKAQAHDRQAYEAILHRAGVVTEGASTTVLAVRDGALWTHPANERILDSITRRVVLRLAGELGIPVIEQALSVEQLAAADEIMLTGTTTHVAAVTVLDGRTIHTGLPGPITVSLFDALRQTIFSKCLSGK